MFNVGVGTYILHTNMLYYATGTKLDKLTMYSLAYHLLCAIRHIGTSFSSWISYLYLMSWTSSVCTDLNQDVGTHICVCLKHQLLVMIWVVKLIEIGCWYSGQPRPLIDNPLMPSEKQMTKVTIKQLGRVVKFKQCPVYC